MGAMRVSYLTLMICILIVDRLFEESNVQFTFGIHIWTFKRPKSLSRLLGSLSLSKFPDNFGADVIFHIDGDYDPQILILAGQFKVNWKFGDVMLDVKEGHVGLPDIFFPFIEDFPGCPFYRHDWSIFLEDDLAVSPYFWDWIQLSLEALQDKNLRDYIIGASLYSPRLNEMVIVEDAAGQRDFMSWKLRDSLVHISCFNSLTAYMMPCSWGSLIRTKIWMEASVYNHRRKNILSDVRILPHSLEASRWRNSWKKIMLEFMYLRKYYYLYPCTAQEESFSTNFMEAGLHHLPDANEPAETLRTWLDDRYTVPLISSPLGILGIREEYQDKTKKMCFISADLTVSLNAP